MINLSCAFSSKIGFFQYVQAPHGKPECQALFRTPGLSPVQRIVFFTNVPPKNVREALYRKQKNYTLVLLPLRIRLPRSLLFSSNIFPSHRQNYNLQASAVLYLLTVADSCLPANRKFPFDVTHQDLPRDLKISKLHSITVSKRLSNKEPVHLKISIISWHVRKYSTDKRLSHTVALGLLLLRSVLLRGPTAKRTERNLWMSGGCYFRCMYCKCNRGYTCKWLSICSCAVSWKRRTFFKGVDYSSC